MKTQLVKINKSVLAVIMILILFGCDKTEVLNTESFVGTYIGEITSNDTNKLISSLTTIPAVADVTIIGDKMEVHCYGEGFDTSLMLDYYPNGNEVRVCLTGDDFEAMYGHALGHGTMHQGGNQWMQHLNDEHETTDEHFGYFNLQFQSFSYMFQLSHGNFLFHGSKN